MKFINLCFFLLLIVFTNCSKEKTNAGGILEPSFGNRNEVVLVIDDSLWSDAVGDSIRAQLAQPTDGLSKHEPIFDLTQYDAKIFSNRARMSRNVVLFSLHNGQEFVLEKSLYATPQNFFFIRAKNTDDLIKLFRANADSIISIFQSSELNEEMHEVVRASNQEHEELKTLFGCTLKIPDSYYLQIKGDFPFLWYQRDLSSGNLNLVLYEFPISEIENNQGIIEDHLIEARDFIGREFLKTAREDGYLTTGNKLPLKITKIKVKDMPVYRISGTWKTVNDFLEGPFICYAIRDEYYNRYLFIEGFINNPFKDKRDQLLEMEAIMKTINFNENSTQIF